MKYLLLIILALNVSSIFASSEPSNSKIELVQSYLSNGLNYLKRSQKQKTIGIKQFKGEWECYEDVDKYTPRIGDKDYSAYDSNVFTTATIHNSLAAIYKDFPEYNVIPKMMDMALENTYLYRNLDKEKVMFNFWQQFTIPEYLLSKGETVDDYPKLRRGNHFLLSGQFVWKASNVEDDADDTSLVLSSFKLHQELFGHNDLNTPEWLPETIGDIFDDHRDLDRSNLNFYNLVTGHDRNTGGFMTWLGTEGTFPGHKLIPSIDEQYIPFGTNDVDCVVNTNVLGALATYGELETTEGTESACKVVNKAIETNNHRSCGVYYPNAYNFYYTASRAYSEGVNCIEKNISHMEEVIISEQSADGSWKVDKKDILQSTAYAMGALMNFKNYSNPKVKISVDKGINYLLESAIHNNDNTEINWKGGIFFSGGRVFRDRVSFRSTPYTTALILEVLSKYRKELEVL
jgi:hypothetical protein